MNTEITIDATKKKLGRLASEIAKTVRGKETPDFLPSRTTFPQVVIKNADLLDVDPLRLKKIEFSRYTGYPGGKKDFTAFEVVGEKGLPELLRRAVWGMLPKNRLRS